MVTLNYKEKFFGEISVQCLYVIYNSSHMRSEEHKKKNIEDKERSQRMGECTSQRRRYKFKQREVPTFIQDFKSFLMPHFSRWGKLERKYGKLFHYLCHFDLLSYIPFYRCHDSLCCIQYTEQLIIRKHISCTLELTLKINFGKEIWCYFKINENSVNTNLTIFLLYRCMNYR